MAHRKFNGRSIVFMSLIGAVLGLGLSIGHASPSQGEDCLPLLPSSDSPLYQSYETQLDKNTFRGVRMYNSYLLTPQPKYSYTALLMRATGHPEPVKKLPQFLALLKRKKADQLRWADEGAGYAIAARELKRDHPKLMSEVRVQAIDQFDWDIYGKLVPNYKLVHLFLGLEILSPAFKPEYVVGDMTHITPEGQDLITSIESIQYAPDKLRAIADWYNKLADDGLMIVSAEHDWTREIAFLKEAPERLENEGRRFEMTPYILKALKDAGIDYGFWGTEYNPNFPRISKLAIRKKPNTRMEITVPLVDTWVNSHKYIFSYYEFSEQPVKIHQL